MTFGVTQVIKGWQEALQLMPAGSKWQLFIPSDIAYAERGSPPKIGPGATLLFDIELVSIQPAGATSKLFQPQGGEEIGTVAAFSPLTPAQ